MINEAAIQSATTTIIQAIGDDPMREGLLDTPRRVAEMYLELFSGLSMNPVEELRVGYELGHREMVIVKDIPAVSSDPQYLTNVGGTVYFTADDGDNGRELWKSDGTAAGTVMVEDIRVGSWDPPSVT